MGDWCGSCKKNRNLAIEIADAVKALKSLANIVQKRTLYPRKKTAFFLNGVLFSLDEGLLMGDPLFGPPLKKRLLYHPFCFIVCYFLYSLFFIFMAIVYVDFIASDYIRTLVIGVDFLCQCIVAN